MLRRYGQSCPSSRSDAADSLRSAPAVIATMLLLTDFNREHDLDEYGSRDIHTPSVNALSVPVCASRQVMTRDRKMYAAHCCAQRSGYWAKWLSGAGNPSIPHASDLHNPCHFH